MKFFVGQDEHYVEQRELGKPAEHFTWCLDRLHEELISADSLEKQIICLDNFKKNMSRTEVTNVMLEDLQGILNQFKRSKKILNTTKILNELMGTCIPDEGYICSYC